MGNAEIGFVLPAGERFSPRGEKDAARANLEAIRLLRRLDEEERRATPDELRLLGSYTGWGSLKPALNLAFLETFREANSGQPLNALQRLKLLDPAYQSWANEWGPFASELAKDMTREEYSAALASTLNAQYTGETMGRQLWRLARRAGFRGGRVLEPGCGNGQLLALMPEDLRRASSVVGVERDDLSARLAKHLHPDASVIHADLFDAQSELTNGAFDLVIANPPYGSEKPSAAAFPGEPEYNLHNAFIRVALQKLRPGGIAIILVSASTMENNAEQRRALSQQADLLGAIRLPQTAFAHARTEVIADVLLLRRRDPEKVSANREGSDWLVRLPVSFDPETEGQLNEYWLSHPDHVLGRNAMTGSMYGRRDTYTVEPDDTKGSFEDQLAEAVDRCFPADVLVVAGEGENAEHLRVLPHDAAPEEQEIPDGSFVRTVNAPYAIGVKRPQGVDAPPWRTSAGDTSPTYKFPRGWNPERLDALVSDSLSLAQAYRAQIALDLAPDTTESQSEQARAELASQYEEWTSRWGLVTECRTLHRVVRSDIRLAGLGALERVEISQAEGGEEISRVKPAFIITRRTLRPPVRAERAETILDAVLISRAESGSIEMERVGELLGIDAQAATRQISEQGLAFMDPKTSRWVWRDEYLSGFLATKLQDARAAQENVEALRVGGTEVNFNWEPNIAALTQAMPARVDLRERNAVSSESVISLGASWAGNEIVQAFLRDAYDQPHDLPVQFIKSLGRWSIDREKMRSNGKTTAIATPFHSAHKVLEGALNRTTLRSSHEEPAVRERAANDGRVRIETVHRDFRDWLFSPVAAEHLAHVERRYNELFGSFVPMRCDGSHLQFPGLSSHFVPRPLQKDAIARVLQEGRALLALGVGFGKTGTGTIVANEMKRLGMSRRTLLVCDNPSIDQFVREIRSLYPTLRLLRIDNEDIHPRGRAEFLERACQGGWDVLVCTRTQLAKIPLSPKTYVDYARQQLYEMEMELARGVSGRGATRKLAKLIESKRDSLKALIAETRGRTDRGGPTFEDLRIEGIIADEAHQFYRRAPLNYPGDPIKGLPTQASQRALDFHLKARVVGRQIVLLTGTPLNNSLAEGFALTRLVAPDVLEKFDMTHFGEFLRTFAVVSTQLECDEATMKWRPVQRITGYKNGPELIRLTRAAMEVRMDTAECGLVVPALRGGGYQQLISPRTESFTRVQAWISKAKKEWESLPREEKMKNPAALVALQAALSASIDPRLVDPNAEDDPRSLVNEMVRAAVDIYEQEYRLGRRCHIPIFVGRFRPMSSATLKGLAGNIRNFGGLMADEGAEGTLADGETQGVPFEEQEEATPSLDSSLDAALQAERREAAEAGWDFNLQHDIQAKLSHELELRGIPCPPGFVVASCDLENSELKDVCALADLGEVGFLIGTHARIGIGLNYQRVQRAQFHTVPADLVPTTLTQARGRGERQGNQYGEIDVVLCAMQDSPAVGILSRMSVKERLCVQLLRKNGDSLVGVDFDDPFTPLNAQEMMAYLVTDPRQRDRAELLQRLRAEDIRHEAECRAANNLEWRAAFEERSASGLVAWLEHHAPLRQRLEASTLDLGNPDEQISVSWTDLGAGNLPAFAGKIGAVQKSLDAVFGQWLDRLHRRRNAPHGMSLGEMTVNGIKVAVSLARSIDNTRVDFRGEVRPFREDLFRRDFRGAAGLLRLVFEAREDALMTFRRNARRVGEAQIAAAQLREKFEEASKRVADGDGPLIKMREDLAALEKDMTTNPRPPELNPAFALTHRVLANGITLAEHEAQHGAIVPFTGRLFSPNQAHRVPDLATATEPAGELALDLFSPRTDAPTANPDPWEGLLVGSEADGGAIRFASPSWADFRRALRPRRQSL